MRDLETLGISTAYSCPKISPGGGRRAAFRGMNKKKWNDGSWVTVSHIEWIRSWSKVWMVWSNPRPQTRPSHCPARRNYRIYEATYLFTFIQPSSLELVCIWFYFIPGWFDIGIDFEDRKLAQSKSFEMNHPHSYKKSSLWMRFSAFICDDSLLAGIHSRRSLV